MGDEENEPGVRPGRRWRVVVEHTHRTVLIVEQAELFAAFEAGDPAGALPWGAFLTLLAQGMADGELPDRARLHGQPRIVESTVLMDA